MYGGCLFLFGSINFIYNYNHVFRNIPFTINWYSFEFVIDTFLLFLIIQNCSFKKVPDLIKKLITKLSEISFNIYLISYIFDTIFYQILNTKVPVFHNKIIFLPVIIMGVFICSSISAYFIEILVKKISSKITIYIQKNV